MAAPRASESSDELLNELILHLNEQYGSEWNLDLEKQNLSLWKRISQWQWSGWYMR